MNITLKTQPTSSLSWQAAPPTSPPSWKPAQATSPPSWFPAPPKSPPIGEKAPPKQPWQRTTHCGSCSAKCVYDAVKMTFLLGVVVNAVVIARVARDRELHQPTFMAIAGLAAADMLFLTGSLTVAADDIVAEFRCIDNIRAYRKYLSNAVLTVWFSAAFHVSLLAVLRFLILTRPLLTRRLLTNRRVLLASAVLWALAIACIGAATIYNNIRDEKDGSNVTLHAVGWFLTYLLPIVITTILHLVKITFLGRFFAGTTKQQESRRQSLARMTRTIAIVIIAGAVLPLPKLVSQLILGDLVKVPIPPSFRLHVESIADTIFFLNFCINPFIYAYNSPVFRKSINVMLGRNRDSAVNQ